MLPFLGPSTNRDLTGRIVAIPFNPTYYVSDGDVVLGLDQISHAMGQAGVAATTIRNHLADQKPIRR